MDSSIDIRSETIQAINTAEVNKASPNQTLWKRSDGNIHTTANNEGTISENQMACTETSAGVGGSQSPAPSSKSHKPGMDK